MNNWCMLFLLFPSRIVESSIINILIAFAFFKFLVESIDNLTDSFFFLLSYVYECILSYCMPTERLTPWAAFGNMGVPLKVVVSSREILRF